MCGPRKFLNNSEWRCKNRTIGSIRYANKIENAKITTTARAMYRIPSTRAKSRMVSNTLAVRRSGVTINLRRQSRHKSAGLAFQLLLDRFECPFERRARFINGDFSDDAAFESCQPRLLRTLERDQVEGGVLRIILIADADGQVQRGLEIVASVKLLHGNGVGRIRRARTAINHGLHHSQSRLQSEIYFFPVKLGLDVF